jgi:hypothetical protein
VPSKPQWFISMIRRSSIATGQPGFHETPIIRSRYSSGTVVTVAWNAGSDETAGTSKATAGSGTATRTAVASMDRMRMGPPEM